jgi:phosphoribosylaminoimidazole carboxylase
MILISQRGIPVATVGINNSTNAALLAIRILGGGLPHLFKATEAYASSLEQEVLQKVENLETEGWDKYVETRLKK